MSSFSGISFEERGTANGAFLPVHGAEVGTNAIPIPGGSIIYLQVGQPRVVTFTLPVRVTAAQLVSLRTKVNTSATLVYTGGTGTATLAEVQDARLVKPSNDYQFV